MGKDIFLENSPKKTIRAIKFSRPYIDLEDQKLVVYYISRKSIEN